MAIANRFALFTLLMLASNACVEVSPVASCVETATSEQQLAKVAQREQQPVCTLHITGDAIEDMDALDGLQPVRPGEGSGFAAVFIDHAPQLNSISGLLQTSIQSLYLANVGLSGTNELPSQFDSVTIIDTDVQSLSWNVDGSSVGINISENHQLESIFIPYQHEISSLSLYDLPMLTDLTSALPSVTSIGRLQIQRCPSITAAEIDALAAYLQSGSTAIHCGNADDEPCEGDG